MLARPLGKLRAMSDEELVKEHDFTAVSTQVGINYYLEELQRRRSARADQMMLRLTWAIAAMTLVVATATTVLLLREPSAAEPSADSGYREQVQLYVADVLLFVAADARYGSCLAERGYSRDDTGQSVFLACGTAPSQPARPTTP